MKFRYSALILFISVQSAFATFDVAVVSTESTSSKSLVKIKAHNNFEQDVTGARAWIFLMDDQGKVVGQKAQWIIGGDTSKQQPQQTAAKRGVTLEAEGEAEYIIAVDHSAENANPPTQTKITFSRIILADGTLANPHKSVKPLEIDDAK